MSSANSLMDLFKLGIYNLLSSEQQIHFKKIHLKLENLAEGVLYKMPL